MRTASLAALILALSACTRQESAPATTAAPSHAWASTRDALIEEYLLNYGGPPIPMVRQQMMGAGGSLF